MTAAAKKPEGQAEEKTVQDHALYRRLSVPCSKAEADARLARFFEMVRVAREECKVVEVVTVGVVNVAHEDGSEQQHMGIASNGSSEFVVPMLDRALKTAAARKIIEMMKAAGLRPDDLGGRKRG